MTQEEVTIKVGERGPDFAKRYPGLVRVVHQPAGLDFYKIDWNQSRPGVARLDNGRHSFVIPNVLGISTSQDLGALQNEGLFEFTVYAGITEPDRIRHDEARLKTIAILHSILERGWQQVIERSDPRLAGKARQDYTFATSNLHGLDATFVPTLDEWMRIESRTPWTFYAGGLYLDVTFTRDHTLADLAQPGSYLLTFHIQTEAAYFRGFAGPDNPLRWKEVLADELSKMQALRLRKESELRAKGIGIDLSYQDPPVPTLQ